MPKISRADTVLFAKIVKTMYSQVIQISGGLEGIRDEGGLYNSGYKLLEFALKNEDKPYRAAAFAYKEFATRHYFMDGNKRTSHLLATLFLQFHNIQLKIEYKQAATFIIGIADKRYSIQDIESWIRNNSRGKKEKATKHHFIDWLREVLESEEFFDKV